MTKITAKQSREMNEPKPFGNSRLIKSENIFNNPIAKKKQKKEESIQIQLAKYLRLKHPDLIFTSDTASGMKMPIHLAAKNKSMQCGAKMPDMFISWPNYMFHGMYLELKKDSGSIYTKKGELRQNKHVIEQNKIHVKLRNLGYHCEFAGGLDEAINMVTAYLSIPLK